MDREHYQPGPDAALWLIPGEIERFDPSARRIRVKTATPLGISTTRRGVYAFFDTSTVKLAAFDGIPLMIDHARTVEGVIGICEGACLVDDVLGPAIEVIARLGHGPRAETAWANITAGVWRKVSCGCRGDYELEESATRITFKKWAPSEVSLCWSGADPGACVLPGFSPNLIFEHLEEIRRCQAERRRSESERQDRVFRQGYRERILKIAHALALDLGVSADAAEAAADRFVDGVFSSPDDGGAAEAGAGR